MQGIRLYLTIFGFMVLLQGSTLGQVVLRDSVTIALHSDVSADIENDAELAPEVKAWLERFSKDFVMSKSSDNNRLLKTNLPAGGLIMPRDARLIILYTDIWRLDLPPLPDSASLLINFASKGDSIVNELLLPHFGNLISGPVRLNCSGRFETHQLEIYNHFGVPNPTSESEQSFGKVSLGDSIQFFYNTDLGLGSISSATEFTLPNGLFVGWRLIFRFSINCLNADRDRLTIFVGLITDSLRITISDPDTIWPTLPANQGGNPNASNVKDTTTVELIQNGIRIPNRDVTITASMILPSGGHDHTIRPQQDSLGVFTIYGANPATANGTITARTDANGRIQFGYRAPIFGGEIEFVATTVSEGDTLVARDTLLVEVADLELLGNGTNYIKIGGTCNHHGPRNDNLFPNCRAPDNNHHGTNTLNMQIVSIADSFVVEFPNHRIQLNDMSLPNGGGFDISGDWQDDVDLTGNPRICELAGNGHCGHRVGENADVGFRIIDPQGQDILTTPEQRRALLEIITRISGDPFEHNDHYHIQ